MNIIYFPITNIRNQAIIILSLIKYYVYIKADTASPATPA